MNVFFTFDEYSDVSDEFETRRQADSMVDALRHPEKPRPEGEWVGGEVTRQYVAISLSLSLASFITCAPSACPPVCPCV